ncbi:MAG: hybrid sensor histidine kinase/response regulator, partial [Marinobacter sp.]|nr:hybrid sensor histidine kinase/response regulator [Marinobacter sp.]
DTGPGIPDDQLAHIFEEFRRFQQGRDKKGLGLGLAIVDRICGMLNHPVNVRSVQGLGSVFSITVPVAPPEPGEQNAARPAPASRRVSSLGGLHVLCIDNDPAILHGMSALLDNWQCDVTTAESLEDARYKLNGTEPDIILADYQLDDNRNGLDAMDSLREEATNDIPGILITGYMAPEVREDAIARGYQILYKPVKPAALRAVVNKLLKQKRP